jgi:CRP/FNR family transcriptional regulator
MPELPSVENTIDKIEALKLRLGFRQFINQYPCVVFSKGQVIFLQNETPSGVFVIESGKVRTYTVASNGHEQLISIHSRGEDIPVGYSFGLVGRSQYIYEAYTKCTIRIIPKDAFLEHLRLDIDLMHQMHVSNMEQLLSALSRIHALGQSRASNKVAFTLIYLADRLGARSWARTRLHELSVTQEEIANLLGMTRETVSSELKKLRIKKIITYSRKRYVLYIERVEEYLRGHR